MHFLLVPHRFAPGTLWLLVGFALVNLLVLLEVADRLSLKNDLEIARDIQQAMLPTAAYHAPGLEAFGMTRPANTVGGDFYDIIPLADGRVLLALGDVAGKGSPAALLMALLLAMLRTLVDEGLEGAALMTRLNVQVAKHTPGVALHHAVPRDARTRLPASSSTSTPARTRRCCDARGGGYERLREGGMALGMFEHADVHVGPHAARRRRRARDVQRRRHRSGETARASRSTKRACSASSIAHGWASAKELGWATFAGGRAPHRRARGCWTI